MKSLILFSIMVLCSASVFGQKTPTFSQYPSAVQRATAKKINFASHPKAKTFRTNLKNALSEGVNFAGKFIVTNWGCGTGCSYGAVIDGKTGNMFFPSQLAGTTPGDGDLDDKDHLEFRKNSRLLIVNGSLGESSSRYGIWYYEWTGRSLRLIKFVKKTGSATP